VEIVDTRGNQALGGEPRVELPGPEDLDAAGGEGAADERPVSLDEAEDAGDWDAIAHDGADDVDLFENAVDELGLVAGADQELLGARSEEAALDLQRRSPLVPLGVDDIDARSA
jgi:hypothetical protein